MTDIMYRLRFFDRPTYNAIYWNIAAVQIADKDDEHLTLTITSNHALSLAEMYIRAWGKRMITINVLPP